MFFTLKCIHRVTWELLHCSRATFIFYEKNSLSNRQIVIVPACNLQYESTIDRGWRTRPNMGLDDPCTICQMRKFFQPIYYVRLRTRYATYGFTGVLYRRIVVYTRMCTQVICIVYGNCKLHLGIESTLQLHTRYSTYSKDTSSYVRLHQANSQHELNVCLETQILFVRRDM